MRWGYRIVSSVLYFYFKIFHRHTIYGIENLPKGPAIIAPNHLSLYDPPIVAASIPEELHFMAKEELFEFRFLKTLIRYLNAHPVSGTEKDLKTMKLICQLLQSGEKVVIFPEGARSDDGSLQDLKTGVSMLAIRNNVPVVPVYIKGSFEIWPIHQKFPKFRGKTTCTIGKPIYPETFSGLGKREAQEALTNAIHESLIKLKDEGP